MDLRRIGDESYLVTNEKEQFIVNIPKEVGTPEQRYHLLSRFLQRGMPPEPAKEVKIGTKQWKLVSIAAQEEQGTMARVGSLLSRFFLPPSALALKKYRLEEISPTFFRRLIGEPGGGIDETQILINASLLAAELSQEEIDKGVKEKKSFTSLQDGVAAKSFTDPFTQLATAGFQKYEPNFTDRDFSGPGNCATCMVLKNGDLMLVENREEKAFPSEYYELALEAYYERLLALYGPDRVAYFEHLFHVNFSEMIKNHEVLTPEIVFRMNMGATICETHGMNETAGRLRALLKNMKLEEGKFALTASVSEALSTKGLEDILLGSEVQVLNQHFATIGEVREWLEELKMPRKVFNELSSAQVDSLMKVFKLDSEARKRALTGREIFEHILGWYNSNQLEEYKPEVDQQQLIQAIGEYEGTKNWDHFYEILTFVICKMQLVREHPTEGYRVGTLIQAPCDENGNERWYRISSVVSNGYGLFSYTFEGVGNDSTLPAIKVWRSTAASKYCMHGMASLRSDLNPLNSPGYLGKGLSDEYETAFFNDRSIPVWVGYLVHAKQLLSENNDLKLVQEALRRANSEILADCERPYQKKNLKQLIRGNDAILIDLLTTETALYGTENEKISEFQDLMQDLQQRYLKTRGKRNITQEKVDAESLMSTLREFDKLSLKPHQHKAIRKLIDELSAHILNENTSLKDGKERALEALIVDGFDDWSQADGNVQEYLQGDVSQAKAELERWIGMLEVYATAHGEMPSQKKQDRLVLAGHSLGGAAAQLHLHHFLFDRGRIPVPGVHTSLHCMDDPGINHDDNEAFLGFGTCHADLLEALDSKIEIYRTHEAGDPVALGGEDHAGATTKKKVAERSTKWLIYDGAIVERYGTARAKAVAGSKTAHATRVRGGKRQKATGASPVKEERADYIEKKVPMLVQGLMDRAGKKKKMTAEVAEVAESFRKDLWKVDLFKLGGAEAFRTGAVGFAALALAAKAEEHPRGEEYFDENGVFSVDERGVQSQRKKNSH